MEEGQGTNCKTKATKKSKDEAENESWPQCFSLSWLIYKPLSHFSTFAQKATERPVLDNAQLSLQKLHLLFNGIKCLGCLFKVDVFRSETHTHAHIVLFTTHIPGTYIHAAM